MGHLFWQAFWSINTSISIYSSKGTTLLTFCIMCLHKLPLYFGQFSVSFLPCGLCLSNNHISQIILKIYILYSSSIKKKLTFSNWHFGHGYGHMLSLILLWGGTLEEAREDNWPHGFFNCCSYNVIRWHDLSAQFHKYLLTNACDWLTSPWLIWGHMSADLIHFIIGVVLLLVLELYV